MNASAKTAVTKTPSDWKLYLWKKIVALTGAAGLCASVHAQTVEYIHTDALGSPVAVTDANGNVIGRTEYAPYGDVLNRPDTDGPGYSGHVLDAATGLNYMQQRYYDPNIGRFLSVDPVSANTATGGNFNRYKYAANNPYTFTDSDGRQEAADRFGDRLKTDAEAGNLSVYKPLEKPAIAITAFMLVGPPALALLPESAATAAATSAGAGGTGGGLGTLISASEAAGGHMVARHVGLSAAQLAGRLATDTGIKAASTFASASTAETSLGSALAANQTQVASWIAGNGGARLVIEGTAASSVGSVLVRGAATAVESPTGRFVLQRASEMAQGFKIVTGYPVP
ncbi:RNase A-like domain-containing protein [Pseudoxanthomonas winnipegensis]|uniref:RNase A-like domain-containing protein n=1 Tax=Pseudoxanthomonas winnipegensis TaxID=2480810 RepID=UPI003CE5B655